MYPKEGSLYRNAFIHRRVLEYKKRGIEVEICVLDETLSNSNEYFYEGIKVIEANSTDCQEYITCLNPQKILVHFISRDIIKVLDTFINKIPIIVWIHLMEATAWYRRLFSLGEKGFLKYILTNTRQLINLRSFVKKSKENNIKFIFVSNWVKKTAEKDMLIKIDNFYVINNVVDTNLFKYKKKSQNLRKNILLIRPFESKKYANDIAVKAIVELSKKPYFSELKFSIYGSGRLFDKTIEPLLHYHNVKINNEFLNHNEIKREHDLHGVFLCPTRQDSQGVSMCEAMSSGLLTITTNNSAIPEFLEDKKSGILTNSVKEIVQSVDYLYKNPSVFSAISEQASKSILEKCNPEKVIKQELEVILS